MLLLIALALQTPDSQRPPQEAAPRQQQDSVTDSLTRTTLPVTVVQQPAAQQVPNEEDGNWPAIWVIGVPLFGVVVAAFALREQRKSNRRRERAYLTVGEVWLEYPLVGEPPYYPVAKVRILNAGDTPAHNVRASIHIYVGPASAPRPRVILPGQPTDGHPIGPRGEYIAASTPGNRFPHKDLGNAIAAPTYAYGLFAYRDAFGKDQTTEFCAWGQASVYYRGGTAGRVELSLCPDGNRAT